MYANCEQVLLKGTLGELVSQNVDQLYEVYTEFDSDTLRIQLSVLAESYYSCRQGEGPPHHVLGQDYSGYASNKCHL